MRITKIFVEKLFGVFDHEIRLNLDDRITIIHSPNGYGKTIILKMLDGLFNDRYAALRKTPYKSFQIEFDNGRKLTVVKDLKNQKIGDLIPLAFTLYEHNGSIIESFHDESINSSSDYTSSVIEILRRFSGRMSSSEITGEESSRDDVIEGLGQNFYVSVDSEVEEDQLMLPIVSSRGEHRFITEIKEEVNTYLIEAQRLIRFENSANSLNGKRDRSSKQLPAVTAYSVELVQMIKENLTEYASISQSLDRSFPARVIKRNLLYELTNEELRSKLAKLEESRNRLMESGLLEKGEEQGIPIQPQDIDENTKNILAVYIEDVEKKLAIFGNIADKIDLFRRIINSKFSYKEIIIDREKGFIFKSKYPEGFKNETSNFLSPSALSSGEQHELVLLYELLFKVKERSLVLIDEPELSLHIGWQVSFLQDLQEISALADLDFLIATHAPDLIGDRWDLTVELKGIS